tara:strand:- start:4008 stop:4346 length:339 start_codon:yes stop_codon:yes gene_type:complete
MVTGFDYLFVSLGRIFTSITIGLYLDVSESNFHMLFTNCPKSLFTRYSVSFLYKDIFPIFSALEYLTVGISFSPKDMLVKNIRHRNSHKKEKISKALVFQNMYFIIIFLILI